MHQVLGLVHRPDHEQKMKQVQRVQDRASILRDQTFSMYFEERDNGIDMRHWLTSQTQLISLF